MFQWHPLFAQLLRPVLQDFYEIHTGVPVGELPREADLVVIRRTSARPPQFQGMWRHLTLLNVVEFKGRTESARLIHVPLLVEVGLGLARRWRKRARQEKRQPPTAAEISFWYLATRLGPRFLAGVAELCGPLTELDRGVWRGRVLGHPLVLVSNALVPLDRESIPVHLISAEDVADERTVAELVVAEPAWWHEYGVAMLLLHPRIWEEVKEMARQRGVKSEPDFKGFVERVGLKRFIQVMGRKRVIEELGSKQVIDELGPKQVIDELGPKQVIDELGPKQVIDELGLDRILSALTRAQRQALKRRLH